MWFKVNRLVQGQPQDQVQGNPHSTVMSLLRQPYGWPPSWTDQRRLLLTFQVTCCSGEANRHSASQKAPRGMYPGL
jgi:hypothetical protein